MAGAPGQQPNFAIGGAPQAAAPAASAQPSIEDRLARLAGLKEKGLISDEEFASRKNAILAEL